MYKPFLLNGLFASLLQVSLCQFIEPLLPSEGEEKYLEKSFDQWSYIKNQIDEEKAKITKLNKRVMEKWANDNQNKNDWAKKWKKAHDDLDSKEEKNNYKMLKDWAQKNKDTNELAKRLYNEELAKFTTTESMSTLEYLAFEKQKKTEIETKSERPQKSENLVIYSQSQEQSKSATSEKISKAEVNDKPNTNEWGGTWKEIHDDPYSVDKRLKVWAEQNKDTNKWAKKLYDGDHTRIETTSQRIDEAVILTKRDQQANKSDRTSKEIHEDPYSMDKRLKIWAEQNKDTNKWAKKLYDEDHAEVEQRLRKSIRRRF